MSDQTTDLKFFLEAATARVVSIQRKLDCGSKSLGSRAAAEKLRDYWQAEADRISAKDETDV